jgi:alpha-glutamyl/putrescinyl thymine pyrophosphorylase clade 1
MTVTLQAARQEAPVLPFPEPSTPSCEPVEIGGRPVVVTPVFDTYWRFAAARQHIYEARQAGRPGPWTADPILRQHRFTNCYRAADRVSQFLIREVAYRGPQGPEDIVFRILLFKLFNKVSTWRLLERHFGEISWRSADLVAFDGVLTKAFAKRERLYSAAYVVPPPQLGGERKHSNHLRLLRLMLEDRVHEKLTSSRTMADAFEVLRSYPAIGDFLAYQFLIDINYSEVLDFDESEFVVPGPGARDGIRKCFGAAASGLEAEVIRYMVDSQEEHFDRLGLAFNGLRGRRLQLIDCQNLFCEVDKYARVAHPDVRGISGRTRIKQKYEPDASPLTAWFPPKWNLNGAFRPTSPRTRSSFGTARPCMALAFAYAGQR